MNCQKCGYTLNEAARFCSNCGMPKTQPKAALCAECGAQLNPGARFCTSCGNPIAPPPVAQELMQTPAPIPFEHDYPTAPVDSSGADAIHMPPNAPTAPVPESLEPPSPPSSDIGEKEQPSNDAAAFDIASMPPPEIPPVTFDYPEFQDKPASESPAPPEPSLIPPPVHSAGPYLPPSTQPGVIPEPRPMGPPPFPVTGQGQPIQRQEFHSPIPDDKPVKGSSIGAIIAALSVVVILVVLTAVFIFDLFGLRTMIGGTVPSQTVIDESAPLESKQDISIPEIGAGRSRPDSSRGMAESSDPASGGLEQSDYGAEFIIELEFDDIAYSVDAGVARVCAGDYWGLIDLDGNILAEPIYQEMWGFFEGYSLVKRDGYYGLIDAKGFEVIPPEWLDAYDFSEGLLAVQQASDEKWGFIDLNATTVVPFQYDYADGFYSGLSVVVENGNVFFIDYSGTQASPYYDDAFGFTNGYAIVMQGDLYGFVDTDFNLVIPCIYSDAYDFYEGAAIVQRSDGRYCLIDTTGAALSPVVDDIWNFYDGYAVAYDNDYYGLIDHSTGEYIITPKYYDMNFYGDGFLPVTDDGENWYYIDLKEQPYWEGRTFEDAWPFSNGFGCVMSNDYWAIIDTEGNLVTGFEYDDINIYEDGMATVSKDGKWGLVKIS